ncbi:hypothetical protein ES705_24486 [subsurface metagenome]
MVRGSATISFAPFLNASNILAPIKGCCSFVFDPTTKTTWASEISSIEFVMAPDPKAAPKPTTVAEWHKRAQWSILLVFKTARANFCIT